MLFLEPFLKNILENFRYNSDRNDNIVIEWYVNVI